MRPYLSLPPTKQQRLWGLIYLAISQIALPFILELAVWLLSLPLTLGQFNGIYIGTNCIVTLLIFRKLLYKELRRIPGRVGKLLAYSLLGFVLYWIANLYVSFVIGMLYPGFTNVNDAAIDAMAAQDYWIIAICTVVLAPISEELLFRGTLFAGFYNRNRFLAYFLSMLLFSAVHVVGYIGMYPIGTLLVCLVQYFPAAFCLCWIYARADSILPPILIHAMLNLFALLTMR